MFAHQHFRLLPGAKELLAGLRQRGLKLALATSSKVKHLQATWDSLGEDLTPLFDQVTNASEAGRTVAGLVRALGTPSVSVGSFAAGMATGEITVAAGRPQRTAADRAVRSCRRSRV